MLTILIQILPFFFIVGIGFTIVKLRIASNSWLQPLGKFALNIGFPSLILSGLSENHFEFKLVFDAFSSFGVFLLVVPILIFLLSKFFKKGLQKRKSTILLSFLFGNAAYLGIPLLTALNTDYQTLATIHAAVMLFIVFTLGLWLVVKWQNNHQKLTLLSTLILLLKNPLLIAVLLGFTINLFNIQLPKLLLTPTVMLGKAVAPMVMLMIGIFIGTHKIEMQSLSAALVYSGIKLLLLPSLLFVFIQPQEDIFKTAILQFAMPAAITPFALADDYDLDKSFLCNAIIFSTLLSVFTLPILIYLLNL